jgi:hypothetical protein
MITIVTVSWFFSLVLLAPAGIIIVIMFFNAGNGSLENN